MNKPLVYVFVGPTAAGKTTLVDELVRLKLVNRCITCTTRAPRPGEVDGQHYRFLDRAEFTFRLNRGEFAESANVLGNWYGTLDADLRATAELGKPVAMILDPQGAAAFSKRTDVEVRVIGVLPPGRTIMSERIRKHRTGLSEGELKARVDDGVPTVRWCLDHADTVLLTFDLPSATQGFIQWLNHDEDERRERNGARSIWGMLE